MHTSAPNPRPSVVKQILSGEKFTRQCEVEHDVDPALLLLYCSSWTTTSILGSFSEIVTCNV